MGVFKLQLASLYVSFVPIVLQFIVSMFRISIHGMPIKACLFPGTTKRVQIFSLSLCNSFTLQMPKCVIVVQLYIFNFLFIFLVVANCSIAALGNNFLNIYNGFMSPPLPVSTLYGTDVITVFD